MALLVQEDGGDYSTLAGALSNASPGEVITISETWSADDTTSHSISQAQTVQCTGAAKHPGHPNNGSETHWRHRATSGHAFTIEADVTLDGPDIGSQSTTQSDECIRINADNADLILKNCLLWFVGVGDQQDCVYFNSSSADGATLVAENCMFWGAGRSGIGNYNADNATIDINACTFYACGGWDSGDDRTGCVGVSGGGGMGGNETDVNALSCLFHESGYDTSPVFVGQSDKYGTVNADRCITNEASYGNVDQEDDCDVSKTFDDADTAGQVIFNQVDGNHNTWDLRLTDSANNFAKDYHSDGSGAPSASPNLTLPSTDILGTTRAAAYECGAFEIAAAGGGGSKALAGTVASISAFTSSSPILVRSIVGSFAASASISSAPVLRKKPVAGSLGASSSLTGALSRLKLFVGSFASSSTFVGALSRLKLFVGSFAGVSAFSGALSKVATGVKSLAGSIVAVSSVSGGVLLRSRVLQGSFAAVSSFAGRLAGGVKALAGSIAGTSAFSSTISIVAQWKNAIMQGINNETGEHFIIDGKIRYKKEK